MLRLFAVLLGIGMVFAGVAGFMPSFMPNGLLLGYFEVNFIHNVAHIVIGVIAIMSATSYRSSTLFFQVLGIFYAILAIASFVLQGDLHVILIHMNMADNFGALVIAAIGLYLGFFYSRGRS